MTRYSISRFNTPKMNSTSPRRWEATDRLADRHRGQTDQWLLNHLGIPGVRAEARARDLISA